MSEPEIYLYFSEMRDIKHDTAPALTPVVTSEVKSFRVMSFYIWHISREVLWSGKGKRHSLIFFLSRLGREVI